jgi:branched-chain amino acid transport system ATP-binding protein
MTPVLQTRALRKEFGGIVATNDVSLALAPGSRHALIGPNGAGKTTLVNLLTGVLPSSGGSIFLDGVDITRARPHRRVRSGIARTFQINQLFADLTPFETLALAVVQRNGGGDWWTPLAKRSGVIAEATRLLSQFHLSDVAHTRTAVLAYGKRKLLEIAIAVALRPRVLLLDEPIAGVPAAESNEILGTLAALPSDVTVLLIEHDMDLVFRFATCISVLVNGALLAEGAPADIARDERVKAAYLGEVAHA